ncbi:hypothetical protein KY308_01665, partial [Candidatus Woesearchaeota archaeon]|nr:hypothetical protein [Candidatus Woesearchaeota archaeon]
ALATFGCEDAAVKPMPEGGKWLDHPYECQEVLHVDHSEHGYWGITCKGSDGKVYFFEIKPQEGEKVWEKYETRRGKPSQK